MRVPVCYVSNSARSGVAQTGGLFTGKEQEWELRCSSLKRLAFVLLSGELDQYQQNLPEIQGASRISI